MKINLVQSGSEVCCRAGSADYVASEPLWTKMGFLLNLIEKLFIQSHQLFTQTSLRAK